MPTEKWNCMKTYIGSRASFPRAALTRPDSQLQRMSAEDMTDNSLSRIF